VKLTRKALAGGPGSSAATWKLERRFPQYYGAKQKVEIAGVDGHELEFQFEAIVDPETRAVLEAALGRADHASLAIE
jgi:hypothetical protein